MRMDHMTGGGEIVNMTWMVRLILLALVAAVGVGGPGVAAGSSRASADPSLIRESFGTGTGNGDAVALLRGPRGTVVAVGSARDARSGPLGFSVLRLHGSGRRDRSFGRGGRTLIGTIAGHRFNVARAAVVQRDGKLLVAGDVDADSRSRMAVVRLDARGRLDQSFGSRGAVVLGRPSADAFRSLAEQAAGIAVAPDGAIVVAGTARETPVDAERPARETRMIVARLTERGRQDRTFGRGGWRILAPGGARMSSSFAVAARPGGVLRVAGSVALPGAQGAVAVVGLTGRGHDDTTFGIGGTAIARPPNPTVGLSGAAIAVGPRGRLTAAGMASSTEPRFAKAFAVRFLADGARDARFGTAGTAGLSTTIGGDNLFAVQALAGGPGGSALIGSSTFAGFARLACQLVALTPDGKPDLTVWAGGILTTRARGCSGVTALLHTTRTSYSFAGRLPAGSNAFLLGTVRLH